MNMHSVTKKKDSKKNLKTVLDFIPFKEVWNDIIYLDNNHIIGCIKIDSINLALLFDEEKRIKVNQLKKVLNAIDYPFKIFCIDKPADLSNNLNILSSKIKTEKNIFKKNILEEDYRYIQSLNNTKSIVNREFFLIIQEDSEHEKLLKQKINDLIQQFNGIGLYSRMLSSDELRDFLFLLLNPCSSLDSFKKDSSSINKSFKEKIAPAGLKISDTYLMIGDAYMSVLTLRSFQSVVDVGWLGEIANVNHTRMVINVSMMDSQEVSTTLKKSISEVKSKMININNYNDQILLNNQMQDYVELVNRIDREHEKFCLLTVNFLCYAESKEQLVRTKKELKATLNAYGFNGDALMFEQERAFKMCLPAMYNDLEQQFGLPVPMLTFAASFPFLYQNLQDDGDAIVLGNDFMGGLVLFDLWKRTGKRTNSNATIVGKSGSGKSTLVKKLVRAVWARGSKVIIIDPEREYRDMCNSLGGVWIDAGTGISGIINPLEVRHKEDNSDDSLNDLSRHFQTFRTFIKYYFHDLSNYELTKIEEVLIEVYKDKGIDFDTDLSNFRSEDYPIMEDLYKKIKDKLNTAKRNQDSRNVIESLEKIGSILKRAVTGADAKIFNGISTIQVDHNSDFIVLDIHSLIDGDETILRTQFFNILSWCWNEISRNRDEQVILVCDEAHLLLDPNNVEGAEFLKRCTKRCRKYNSAVWTITQNFIDYTASELERYGQVIIDNSTYILVMEQGQKEIESVQKMMNLSESEVQFLTIAEKGEGLFSVGQSTRIPIHVNLREEERLLFGKASGR